MRRIVIGLFILCAGFISQAQQVNDANAVKREVGHFHGISVSSAFDVYLTQGGEEAVAVSANDKKYTDNIIVEVKDGILYVRYDNRAL